MCCSVIERIAGIEYWVSGISSAVVVFIAAAVAAFVRLLLLLMIILSLYFVIYVVVVLVVVVVAVAYRMPLLSWLLLAAASGRSCSHIARFSVPVHSFASSRDRTARIVLSGSS